MKRGWWFLRSDFLENVNVYVFKTRAEQQCAIRWLWLDLGVFSWLLLMQKCKRFRIKSYLEREEMWFSILWNCLFCPLIIICWQIKNLASSCHLKQINGLLIQSIQGIILCCIKTWSFSPHFPEPLFAETFLAFSAISMCYKEIISKMADAVVQWRERLNDKCGLDRLAASVFLGRRSRCFIFLVTFFGRKSKTWSGKNKH